MRARPGRRATAVVAVAALMTAALGAVPDGTPAASALGARTGAVYVALGDSYAAGEGLAPYEPASDRPDNTCHRSLRGAYAVARGSNGRLVVRPDVSDRSFWACSGATAVEMRRDVGALSPSAPGHQAGQPRQVPDTVGRGTRWVSLSAGGNDVAFSDLVRACVLGLTPTGTVYLFSPRTCTQQLAVSRTTLKARLPANLTTLYRQILDAAPLARLVVVGYPRLLPDRVVAGASLASVTAADRARVGIPPAARRLCVLNSLGPVDVGVADVLVPALNRFQQDLNRTALDAVVSLAAKGYTGRITFADTWSASRPHTCTGTTVDPTVNGIVLATGPGANTSVSTASVHPTASGQLMMGRQAEAAFGGALASIGSPWPVRGTAGVRMVDSTIAYAGGDGRSLTVTRLPGAPSWLTVTGSRGRLRLVGTPPTAGSSTFGLLLADHSGHRLRVDVALTVSRPRTAGR